MSLFIKSPPVTQDNLLTLCEQLHVGAIFFIPNYTTSIHQRKHTATRDKRHVPMTGPHVNINGILFGGTVKLA